MYPHGEAAAVVTGQMMVGRTGLEKQYWRELYSVNLPFLEGIKQRAAGVDTEGNCIVTTIDMKLQKAAYEALDGYRGAIGVLEVNSGRILALVSTPTFDPNELPAQWEELKLRTDAPFVNRVTGGLYPPGSTFKLITTLAYLQQHKAEDFSYTCTGTARFRNTTVHCNNEKAHGEQTLSQAFANSCNTAYAYMGEQITDEVFMAVAEQLGFGTVWEDTLLYKQSSFSITEETSDASRVQASFGQGEILMTPFHKLMLAAGIANGGTLQFPYLVERVENCNGNIIEQYASGGEKQLMSPEQALLLKDYMIAASEDKMQEYASRGITVAGKTGSAESPEGTHSWYLCFAPADNPKIAIVVLMEGAGSGSRYAVPAAKQLLNVYFPE